jgi:hypothetical protein
MSHENLDPRLEKLVALLYGELPDDEARELQNALASDAELRRTWEELQETREVLATLDPVPAPDRPFLMDEPLAPAPVSRPAGAGEGLADRLRGWFGGGVARPAWAAAALLVVVAGLALADFRVQRIDGGFALRFGDAPAATLPVREGTLANATDMGIANPGATQSLDDGVELTPVAGGPFLTRDDLADYEAEMLKLVGAMFQDYERYRDAELAGIVRAMYSDISNRQDEDTQELRRQIEAMGLSMMLERSDSRERLQKLLDEEGTEGGTDAGTLNQGTPDQENDR